MAEAYKRVDVVCAAILGLMGPEQAVEHTLEDLSPVAREFEAWLWERSHSALNTEARKAATALYDNADLFAKRVVCVIGNGKVVIRAKDLSWYWSKNWLTGPSRYGIVASEEGVAAPSHG